MLACDDVEYVLSKGGMTLPLQGQGHSIRVTKLKKGILRLNNCTPFSVNSTLFRQAESSRHFSNANIQYFVESYDGLVKLVV